MGYSLGVHARSQELRERMLDFMATEYRPHWRVRGVAERPCYSSPPGENPSYCHGPHLVGLDFNASGFERGYAFALIRWMALRVGRKTRKFTGEGEVGHTFESPVPYMLYDTEKWPLLQMALGDTPEKLRWCCVDSLGLRLEASGTTDFVHELHPDVVLAAQVETCRRHGIDPDNWPEPSEEPPGIRWKIHDTRMAILEPELRGVIEPIRVELRRLSEAWGP